MTPILSGLQCRRWDIYSLHHLNILDATVKQLHGERTQNYATWLTVGVREDFPEEGRQMASQEWAKRRIGDLMSDMWGPKAYVAREE